MGMEQFIISEDAKILDALKLIDSNKRGFAIVLKDGVVFGTLTDGDIRRALLRGKTLGDGIEDICCRQFRSLMADDDISAAIELFKQNSIGFLPILNRDGSLANLLTKSQMHALLLQDINADLNYPFLELDGNLVDYEIFARPWGFYKTTVLNDYFRSKIISVKPGGQLSLQEHHHREEYWIVAHGTGTAQIADTVIDIRCGSSLFIPKGCKHRLTNTDEKESLIITEVQIGDYFGEDDIIRYEDVYGRH